MIDALYISASGLRGEQKQIDVISNNVANMQTPGFKRSRVNFAEVATAAVAAQSNESELTTQSLMRGNGARVISTSTLFSPGEMRQTQGALDLAIDGNGFFELEAADGSTVYTRDGQFRLDDEGFLASIHGQRLAHSVQIPADAKDIRIDAKGEITALLAGDEARSVLGDIELATFAAPDALVSIGNNRYVPNEASGMVSYGRPNEPGFGQLQQGYVELANVEMIDEMSALVLAQRAYQLNARVLQAADQVLETINNLRR